MAKINENPLVRGARGNFGKQMVYRKRGNDTFLTRMPVKNDAPPTEKQEAVRDQFAAASQYATGAMNDPALKKAYGKKAPPGKTAYNMAFRDFLKPPKVQVIDTENYDGKPGSTVVVTARDDFSYSKHSFRRWPITGKRRSCAEPVIQGKMDLYRYAKQYVADR
jgi:hypothetical protein